MKAPGSTKSRKGNKHLKKRLLNAAAAIKNKSSFFHAQHKRLAVRMGGNKAAMAVAHSMLIAIYHILSGNEFKDLGADYYVQFNREKKINSHIKQLSKLGIAIPDDVLQEAFARLREPPPYSA